MAIQGYTELYTGIQGYAQLYTAIQTYTGLYTAIRGYTGLYGAIHSDTYILLTKREVKMAGYWPSSLFAFLWTETKSRSIKT